jgi:hypothetical protein
MVTKEEKLEVIKSVNEIAELNTKLSEIVEKMPKSSAKTAFEYAVINITKKVDKFQNPESKKVIYLKSDEEKKIAEEAVANFRKSREEESDISPASPLPDDKKDGKPSSKKHK